MIEQLAAAMQQRDYAQAQRLLEPLLKTQPHHPWVQLYAAQLHEVAQRPDKAQVIYRRLLQTTNHQQVLRQARRGLARLTAAEPPAAAAEPSESQPSSAPPKAAQRSPRTPVPPTTASEAILLLRPVDAADRDQAIAAFANLMAIDRYTARTQLPQRGWRFHSSGPTADLGPLAEQLNRAGIPAQVLPLEAVQALNTFRVSRFQQISPPSVLCQSATGQQGTLAFHWSEVAQWVSGRLPIFEEVVDRDARKRLLRKQKTQDYAYILDIHLPKRRSILRLCDQTYQFESGAAAAGATGSAGTRQQQWQQLNQEFTAQCRAPLWTEFVPFGESAQEPVAMLPPFPNYIDILRKRETPWDRAFHLYSSAIFYQ